MQVKITNLDRSRWKDLPIDLKEKGYKVGAEIGVLKGEYTEVLCKQGFKMYGIDLWEPYDTYKDFQGKEVFDAYYKEAQERLSKYDCTLIKGWSSDVVKQFENESLDFIFIDGNHAFEYVVEDLAKWSPKVKKGGIISGHDFFNKYRGRSYGVQYAVPAWCEANRIKEIFLFSKDSCPSWMYVK